MLAPPSYSSLPPCPFEPMVAEADQSLSASGAATSFYSRGAAITLRRSSRGRIYIAAALAVGCFAAAFIVATFAAPSRLGSLRRKYSAGAVQFDVSRPCPGHENACLLNKTCTNGLQCYEKAAGIWAACKEICVPGETDPCDKPKFRTPWTCKWLGGSVVVTKAPVGTWNEAMEALIDGRRVIPRTVTTTTTTETKTMTTVTSTSITRTSSTVSHTTMTTVTRTETELTTTTLTTNGSNAASTSFPAKNATAKPEVASLSAALTTNTTATTTASLGWRTSITSMTTTTSTQTVVPRTSITTTRTSSVEVAAIEKRTLCGEIEHDVDYQSGQSLKVVHPVHRAEDCCDACAAVLECKAWTWALWGAGAHRPNACYLKSAAPTTSEKKPSDGLVSGLPSEYRALHKDIVGNKTEGTTLFCYMVIVGTGSETEIAKAQVENRIGVFACQGFAVYSQSDDPLHLGDLSSGSVMTVPIPGAAAWLAPVSNTAQKVWHNTNVFARAWKKLREAGEFRKFQWSVKVDADAVFVPWRLGQRLDKRGFEPQDLIFFLNCPKWKSLQGPLEVLSRAASEVFFGRAGQQRCFRDLDWSNWGEDWFVQNCLIKLGARAEDGYDFLEDQWCSQNWVNCGDEHKVAYHPFKKMDDFMSCKDQAGASSKFSIRKMQDDAMIVRK